MSQNTEIIEYSVAQLNKFSRVHWDQCPGSEVMVKILAYCVW